MKTENTIPVLEKAIQILEFLGGRDGASTQSEIMSELGISQATCYRTLQTFMKHDCVKKDSRGRYDLSHGFLEIGRKLMKNAESVKSMQKFLDSLSEKTGLSSKLSMRKGFSEYSTMLRAEPEGTFVISGKVGASFPIIEGSVAGVLLCDSEDSEIEKLIKATPSSVLEKSDTDILYSRIRECREKGYCFSGKKNRWNIEVVSTPVRGGDGNIFAAISLIGFPEDFEKNTKLFVSEIIKAKKECEAVLNN